MKICDEITDHPLILGLESPDDIYKGITYACTVQVSISSTFYKQLLHAQIPKVQKDWKLDCIFLHLWDLFT